MSTVAASRSRIALVLWLASLVVLGVIISRAQFTADMSAFLPRSPTPAQQLLLEQLRDGLASRLILVGIEGADAATRARLSKDFAQRLRADNAFASVNNGEPVTLERDRALLFENRYLLSPAVTPERFGVEGLRTAISDSIDLLASPAGMLTRTLLARDPTGELVQLLQALNGGNRPRLIEGAWTSRDGARALLLIRTRALGSDTDAQQRAMETLRAAFEATRTAVNEAQGARLVMAGPGVFSVSSRATIKNEVHRLSLIGIVVIVTLLLLVYRSLTALALGILPVVTGALAGVAAVSLGFGVVHGITLGFGTALIGEAVDYSIYLFVQSEQGGADTRDWVQRFWPTIRLGVLTSICGFASLLLSGFPGLAQLGLYAISGLVVAALVTRFVLPHLLPANFRIHDLAALGHALSMQTARASRLRWLAVSILVAASAMLIAQRGHLWNSSLASLSPIPAADIALDTTLRADLGAPDARYLMVVSGPDRESVLQHAERVSILLQQLVEQNLLTAYESPNRFLPSMATQRARLASLPDAATLEARLPLALEGLPLRAQRLAPFVADITRAREGRLLQAADLELTSMGMALDALLLQRGSQWSALLPLTAPANGVIDAARMRAVLRDAAIPQALFVDLKAESDDLYAGYLHEAIVLSLGGLIAIVVLLLAVTRSPRRVLRVIAPLAAAVISVAAGLAALGQPMTLLHLVGLLLVVAVGSNYALFFDRAGDTSSGATISPRTLASMLVANVTTVAGFGVLAFSQVSVLQALGVTVAPGVILALVYAAIFARGTNAH